LEIEKVIEILKSKDPKKISEIMRFPYKFCDRFYPDICDENDFIKRFDEVFDDEILNKIFECKRISKYRIKYSGQCGCCGFMINKGLIWMDYSSGGIFRVNRKTEVYKKKLKKLIEDEKKKLHSSLRNFIVPVSKFLGIDVLVRIDLLESEEYIQQCKFRLCIWKKKNIKFEDTAKLERTKPDIVLDKSVVYTQASMGLITYNFSNNNDYIVIIEPIMDSAHAKGLHEKIFKDQKIDGSDFSMKIYFGYYKNFNFQSIESLSEEKDADFIYNFCKKESYNIISIY
jgi:hypothetical protein